MTEQEAIDLIDEKCMSGDKEANGSRLDAIIQDYLRENGAHSLADRMDAVQFWRG